MNLKTAMLEALVQEWEGNARMNRVVELAWSRGKKPADDVRKYTDLAAAVRAKAHRTGDDDGSMPFVGRYLPKMGDALLDRRPTRIVHCRRVARPWRANDDNQERPRAERNTTGRRANKTADEKAAS